MLFIVAVGLLRYPSKILRLKYLFAHHRLHEQIGLEINSNSALYSHLPTSEQHNHPQRSLEDVLADETELTPSGGVAMADIHQRADEFVDDPFYVDEKQPIFNADRFNGRSNNTGLLWREDRWELNSSYPVLLCHFVLSFIIYISSL